ncbi:MAG: hypothetical protein J6T95_01425 [Oscillospiraceae bacterium]|nr:hypothetical protein [Oscillospiraceae bacterium]
MAKLTTMDGTKVMTGAVRKKKEQGVDHFSNTRQKRFVDPETGEVLKLGPNEMFIQKWRDYTKAPRTPAEQVQNLKWRDACKLAQQIKKDRLLSFRACKGSVPPSFCFESRNLIKTSF